MMTDETQTSGGAARWWCAGAVAAGAAAGAWWWARAGRDACGPGCPVCAAAAAAVDTGTPGPSAVAPGQACGEGPGQDAGCQDADRQDSPGGPGGRGYPGWVHVGYAVVLLALATPWAHLAGLPGVSVSSLLAVWVAAAGVGLLGLRFLAAGDPTATGLGARVRAWRTWCARSWSWFYAVALPVALATSAAARVLGAGAQSAGFAGLVLAAACGVAVVRARVPDGPQ